MPQTRGGSYAGDAQDVGIPQSQNTPSLPVNFKFNSASNQLECDRDSSDNMSGGTFHFEWATSHNAADADWTELTPAISNPASGSVIKSLVDQVAGRWYRCWKVTSGGYAGPKTLPIQNAHPSRVCLILGDIAKATDAPPSAARVEYQYDTSLTSFSAKGGKRVVVRREPIYPDDEGAWSEEIYRTSDTTYNVKFWILTREQRLGPFTKIIPDQTTARFEDLVDA